MGRLTKAQISEYVAKIDDKPVLQFLELLESRNIAQVYNAGLCLTVWYPSAATAHEGFSNSILNALPYGGDHPTYLRKAKIASMVKRGLVSGCLCGCRGDFRLTPAGRVALSGQPADRTRT